MSANMKRMLMVGLLLLTAVSFGCAGGNTMGYAGHSDPSWGASGDVESPYPPYFRPTK